MAAAPPEAPREPTGSAGPELSVVIVNWRSEQATIALGRRVSRWHVQPRVVIVDNDSGAAAVTELQEALPAATVLANPANLGFGGALNVALRDITSAHVLLLNNDAAIGEQAVEHLTALLRARPAVGLAGPVFEDPTPPHSILAAGGRDIAKHGRTHFTGAEKRTQIDAGEPYAVDYVPGTVALIRTTLLKRLGGLCETYFFSGEMADLGARARSAGASCMIVPAARGRHDLAAAGPRRDTLYRYYSLRNRFLFIHRIHPRTAGLGYRTLWVLRGVAQAIAATLGGNPDRARALWLGLVDGLRGRYGAADERVPA